MGNFTIVNGQIYTPGLAIVDAPQPNTPLGGGKPTPQACWKNSVKLTRMPRKPSGRDRCLGQWQTPLATIHAIRQLANSLPQHHPVSDLRTLVAQLHHLQWHRAEE